jgi:phosphatidylglycerol:prolipoprotein diacylglycerol transferase
MSAPLQFPQFDPVAIPIPFHIGSWQPSGIRWYALAYIAGILLAWQLVRRLVQKAPAVATPLAVDDFLSWAVLGVVLGGRLGYVLIYQPLEFLAAPWRIFAVWEGGMSFHGGMLGVAIAMVPFCRQQGLRYLGFADRVAVGAPIGLFLGRCANFINGELWGRKAPDWLPWRMIFPNAGPDPRHPSQIYQALMEGVLLFVILFALSRSALVRARFGMLTGCFLIGYGIFRIIGEMFREPDGFLGYLFAGATMGQWLSAPMVIAGIVLVLRAKPDHGAA